MVHCQTQRLSQQSEHLREASGALLRVARIECPLLAGSVTDLPTAGVWTERALSNDRISKELLHAQQAGDRQNPEKA